MTAVGKTIRRMRTEKGLSQAEMAEKAESAPETISRIEGGKVEPGAGLLARIADVLGVSPAEIRGAAPRKKSSTRPGIAKLVGLVEDLDDEALELVVTAVKALIEAGRSLGVKRRTRP